MVSRTDKLLETATRKAAAGDMVSALRLIDELIEREPYHEQARRRRSQWRVNAGRFEEALEDCRVVLQLYPRDYETLSTKGDCLLRLGCFDDATQAYLQAVNIHPRDQRALAGLKIMADEGLGIYTTRDIPEQASTAIAAFTGGPMLPARAGARIGSGFSEESAALLYAVLHAACPSLVFTCGAISGIGVACVARALEQNGHGYLHHFAEPGDGDVETAVNDLRRTLEANGLAQRSVVHRGVDFLRVCARVGVPDFLFLCRPDADAWQVYRELHLKLPVGAITAVEDEILQNQSGRFVQRLVRQGFRDDYEMIGMKLRSGSRFEILQKRTASAPLSAHVPAVARKALSFDAIKKLVPAASARMESGSRTR